MQKEVKGESRLKRQLRSGEKHQYSIHLEPGEFAHIRVQQYDIDVMILLTSDTGNLQEIYDSPTGELDKEDIFVLSKRDGNFKIEIYPAQKYADPGEYDLNIVVLRIATEGDRKWMAAIAATQKADKLRSTPATRQQSMAQYEASLLLWSELKARDQYAGTLRSLGFVYIREKNYDKAIGVFNKLLPIWKEIGDLRAEGFTHLIIGRIYNLQKDYNTSLAYNLNSLPIWKTAKDTDQESFVMMNVGNLYAQLGDKQKAIDFFEQALKRNETSKRPSIKAVILRDFGTAMILVGEAEKGIQLYVLSMKQWQSTVNAPEEARTAVLLGNHFAGKNDQLQANQYYNHSMEIWHKLDDLNEIQKVKVLLDRLKK